MIKESLEVVQKIKTEREEKGIFANEMAAYLDINEKTYRGIEDGSSPLTLERFLMICKKLRRTPEYFLGSLNNTYFTNCINSGNNNTYNINEATSQSIDTLRMLIESLNGTIQKFS